MKKKIFFMLLLTGLILFNTNSTFAQAGTLDNSFSGDGKVTTITNGKTHLSYGESVAIQANGKIVVAGYETYDATVPDRFVVVQYNSTGTLDNTFGGGDGIVSTSFTYSAEGKSVAIQKWDEKIVVAGTTNGQFAIARYTSTGILDNTFGGGDGIVITGFASAATGQCVAINQLNHSIVVAGSSNGDFVVARYSSTGTLDKKFSIDGKATIDFGDLQISTVDECYSVAIQSDGKILLAGSSGNDFAVARLKTNGEPDSTFGVGSAKGVFKTNIKEVDGKVTTHFGLTAKGYSVAIQPNGKIVVAGYNKFSLFSGGDFAMARYNANGSPDSTFSGDGKVTTGFEPGYDDHGMSVAIESTGKIVVAGYSRTLDDSIVDFALARYTSRGLLDNTFSLDGKVTTAFGVRSLDKGHSLAIQSNGGIVVAGVSLPLNDNYYDIAVARYIGSTVQALQAEDKSVALDEINAEAITTLRLYPNPVTDILHVEGLDPSAVTTISITGQSRVIQKVVTAGSNYSFNVKMLPPGIYYVSIVENKKTTNLKFIKQ